MKYDNVWLEQYEQFKHLNQCPKDILYSFGTEDISILGRKFISCHELTIIIPEHTPNTFNITNQETCNDHPAREYSGK